ncbi:MAG TPA: hypothetical protein VMR37_05100 [Rhabdochlamydiaceae bacterium]|jgi:hypothetical protein|nr:hypothetical protein [Rhabdochlamydiaceae bacterium]
MASFFQGLWGSCSTSQQDYYALQKKDDNLGIEEAQVWVQSHPLLVDTPEKLKLIETDKAERCAKEIIESLKKFPITPKNIEIIQPRLLDFCRWNPTISNYLIKHFKELQGDRPTIDYIQLNIITISCH